MNRLQLVSNQITQQKTSPQFTKLSINYKGSIGYISLRSPKDLNSLGEQMRKEIIQALLLLNSDDNVYVIVIVSQISNIFCAGVNIKQFVSANYTYESGLRNEPIHAINYTFSLIRKPIIAAVNGKALGGGFELALLCDIILASEKSYFGLPEINLGLMPGMGGTQIFTKIVGEKKAMRHILTAQGIEGPQAWQLSIAEKVSSQNFNEQVQAFAQKIASKALTSVIIIKKAIKQSSNLGVNQGMQFEKDVFYSMFNTKAAKEGINSFINKKKADFRGL